MKIAHITDIHFQTAPNAGDLLYLKRLMGSTNLYILGRKSKFSAYAQEKSIEKLLSTKPDLVIITGDITAQALDAEFLLAQEKLHPIISTIPTVLQAGNHDAYVEKFPPKMRACFGETLVQDGVDYKEYGDVGVLTIESCQPSLLSQGYVEPSYLEKASMLLDNATASFVFLCMHYPLLGRRGEKYGPSTRALRNADMVLEWLSKQSKIHAYLHGHEHHGYQTSIPTAIGNIPSINPGVSGYKPDNNQQRYPHFCVYTVENGKLLDIDRYRFRDDEYQLEDKPSFSSKL